jgi:hypothetical protein
MAAPTITSLGNNTTQITLNQSTIVEMTTAVKNAITGLTIPTATTFSNGGTTGWDLVWEGYLHDYTKVFHQVFRALNKDGVSYKPLILRWYPQENELWVTTCENITIGGSASVFTAAPNQARTTTYNNTTFVNEAFTWENCSATPFKMDACDLIINVDARHFIVQSYIASEPGPWQGIFEIQRNDPLDTPTQSKPCWGFIGSTLWMLGVTNNDPTTLNASGSVPLANSPGRTYPLICMPSIMKSTGRATGYSACIDLAADFGIGTFPTWTHYSSTFNPSYHSPALPALMSNDANNGRFQFSGWDKTKRAALPISVVSDYASTAPVVLGQIYGLKLIGPVGQSMNKMKLTVDSDGSYSASGTEKDHFILNIHHKNGYSIQAHAARTELTYTTLGSFPGDSSYGISAIVSAGSCYIAVQGTKVYKVDAFSGGTSLLFTASGAYTAHRFDGEKYFYMMTSSQLHRIDVYQGTVNSYTVTSSAKWFDLLRSSLGVDNILYTTINTTVAPVLYKYDIGTLTNSTLATSPTVANSIALGSLAIDAWGNIAFQTTAWIASVLPFRIKYYSNTGVWTEHSMPVVPSTDYQYQYHNNIRLINSSTFISALANGGPHSRTAFYKIYVNVFNFSTFPNVQLQMSSFPHETNMYPPYAISRFFGNLVIGGVTTQSNGNNYSYAHLSAYGSTYFYGNTANFADTTLAPTNGAVWTLMSDGVRAIMPSGAGGTALRVISGFGSDRVYNQTKLAQIAVVA